MRESPMLVTVLSTVYGKLGNRKEVVPVMTTLSPSPLTASDRCDRCGAQAYVRVTLTSGGELLFCGHHARKHLPALEALASHIQDETERMDENAN
jgi:hypothetical protein